MLAFVVEYLLAGRPVIFLQKLKILRVRIWLIGQKWIDSHRIIIQNIDKIIVFVMEAGYLAEIARYLKVIYLSQISNAPMWLILINIISKIWLLFFQIIECSLRALFH